MVEVRIVKSQEARVNIVEHEETVTSGLRTELDRTEQTNL